MYRLKSTSESILTLFLDINVANVRKLITQVLSAPAQWPLQWGCVKAPWEYNRVIRRRSTLSPGSRGFHRVRSISLKSSGTRERRSRWKDLRGRGTRTRPKTLMKLFDLVLIPESLWSDVFWYQRHGTIFLCHNRVICAEELLVDLSQLLILRSCRTSGSAPVWAGNKESWRFCRKIRREDVSVICKKKRLIWWYEIFYCSLILVFNAKFFF